ncbi:MAG: LptF/LptG family permease [Spirochaetaceae bacterium]|jgi:lipopolysaccharide export system permease protein|nr:LptF/LptG family permease [Spirochaetaceae bacterium]
MRANSLRGGISGTILGYLLKETLLAFFVSFLFFFIIFFVNQLLLLAQEILSKKVPFNQVALLVMYSIPSVVALSTPYATLLGTLMTIGRMNTDNEILVMLSSGLSYKNIFIPTLLVGIFVSLVSFAVNDIMLPAGTIEFSKLYRRIMASTPALELEANSVKRFKDTVVITGNVSGQKISDLIILDKTTDGERRVIMAKNAEFVDAGREGLRLDMENAFIQSTKENVHGDYDYAQSGYLRYRIEQDDFIVAVSTIGPREMSSRDVLDEIKIKEDTLNSTLFDRYNRLVGSALALEDAMRGGKNARNWGQRLTLTQNFLREYQLTSSLKSDRILSVWRLEFYKKFSIPFGSLCFIFLAVPLGLLAKKSGQTVGFILGIIISVVYWALLLGGQNMGIRLGYSPFWTMWLPNIITFVIGVVMCVQRVSR